ncbi:Transmembrane protein isoform 1, partial [Schistosoma japonicum]
ERLICGLRNTFQTTGVLVFLVVCAFIFRGLRMVYLPYINETLNFMSAGVKHILTSQSKPVIAIEPKPLICWESMLVRLAGLSGALAVIASAYGAHGFGDDHEKQRQVFKTGAYYHLVHSVALLNTPLFKRPLLSAALFATGTVLFSGSCYYVALTGDDRFSRIAPIGGMTLVFAWFSLLF